MRRFVLNLSLISFFGIFGILFYCDHIHFSNCEFIERHLGVLVWIGLAAGLIAFGLIGEDKSQKEKEELKQLFREVIQAKKQGKELTDEQIDKLFEAAYKKGYKDGYKDGYSDGESDGFSSGIGSCSKL